MRTAILLLVGSCLWGALLGAAQLVANSSASSTSATTAAVVKWKVL